jgi:hypothetical protein
MPVITASREAEIGRRVVLGQSRQKVSKIPSQPISWMWWYTPVNPTTWQVIGMRTVV